jgi:hypothetical protein
MKEWNVKIKNENCGYLYRRGCSCEHPDNMFDQCTFENCPIKIEGECNQKENP